MNWRTPLTPRENRRLVPRAARVHALGGPFSSRQGLKQKRNRHVGFMDRAEHPNLSQCVVRGPRLVEHLGPFYWLSSREKLKRKKRDRCLWLGNGLFLTHTYSQPRGARQRESSLFSFRDDVGSDTEQCD